MYQIIFENNQILNVDIQSQQPPLQGTLSDKNFSAEIQQTHAYEFFMRYNNRSYNILLLKVLTDEKKLILRINGKRVSIQVKDKFDLLLQQLGMDKMSKKKTESIKAPMPGMVLKVLVEEGQAIKKGDTILILEAMKMENALKAPHDGIVKRVAVNKGTAVEKNQLLVEL